METLFPTCTRSAKESNHYCAIIVTARSRVVGLCLKSVDAAALTAVSNGLTKARTIFLRVTHSREKEKVWRRVG